MKKIFSCRAIFTTKERFNMIEKNVLADFAGKVYDPVIDPTTYVHPLSGHRERDPWEKHHGFTIGVDSGR